MNLSSLDMTAQRASGMIYLHHEPLRPVRYSYRDMKLTCTGRQKVTGNNVFDRAGFTPAETRLAQALANGMNLKEYSGLACISVTTARNQLASLFAKTGTHRQAELVAWLLRRT